MSAEKMLLGLDLAISLATRLLAVSNAMATAAAQGRDDLSDAELDSFAAADDAAALRLQAKIEARRAGHA